MANSEKLVDIGSIYPERRERKSKVTKTLILVRHAQRYKDFLIIYRINIPYNPIKKIIRSLLIFGSLENVKVIDALDMVNRWKNFTCCTGNQFCNTLSLLGLTIDSKVSEHGHQQIQSMHNIMKEKEFWSNTTIDSVLCSPLERARDTCYGILPRERKQKVRVIPELEEATPYEHVFSKTLLERIERFKLWLADCEENTILIVGHSQYFKKMLGMKTLMRNCDVWEVKATIHNKVLSRDGVDVLNPIFEWGEMKLLHRTPLADAHAFDKFNNTEEDRGTDHNNSRPPVLEKMHLRDSGAAHPVVRDRKDSRGSNRSIHVSGV